MPLVNKSHFQELVTDRFHEVQDGWPVQAAFLVFLASNARLWLAVAVELMTSVTDRFHEAQTRMAWDLIRN